MRTFSKDVFQKRHGNSQQESDDAFGLIQSVIIDYSTTVKILKERALDKTLCINARGYALEILVTSRAPELVPIVVEIVKEFLQDEVEDSIVFHGVSAASCLPKAERIKLVPLVEANTMGDDYLKRAIKCFLDSAKE